MTSSELRRSFLEYFQAKGHRIVASGSLVPHDDPTLLFTNAGMNQFKDLFLGREQREYRRATTAQKCMRVSGKHNDLDNVGPSLRHHTFFEMLGNFSFGDYFKHDAIQFAWELLTGVWALPADRLFVTIFQGEPGVPRDDEAYARWLDFVPADRIVELGAADNFWQMGDTGPCGRCSEIHYFRGAHLPCPEPVCLGPACECDRFVEVWNNVFMEFDRQQDGTLNPLPKPSIDTGMGLERIVAVTEGTLSNYDTDTFRPLLLAIAERTGQTGDDIAHRLGTEDTPSAVSSRVVADHVRAMTFLIADGVMPSNEWRGYVLRKIMRRAMRHGKRLGTTEPFLYSLVDVLVDQLGGAYPELPANRDAIVRVVRSEEDRFDAVLSGGLSRLEEVLDRAAAQGGVVSGDDAFKLYDTFGLPLDFIEDLAGERRLAFDREGFDRAMEAQRQKARVGSAFLNLKGQPVKAVVEDKTEQRLRAIGDVFEGYTGTLVDGATVVAVLDGEQKQADRIRAGSDGFVLLDRTPFYVASGGQVSDIGELRDANGSLLARVEDVVKMHQPGWPRGHRVHVEAGELHSGSIVIAAVTDEVRDATRRNHTATHLLHAALRQVLGPHVKQAGSLVAPDRLRFDFAHQGAVTREQLDEIERIVNTQIYRNVPVATEVKPTAEAMAAGAMALFGEKYGDRVRVVTIPGFSMELCGGTHVKATGDIGPFVIVEEGGVAAGVRRIEALTGAGAVHAQQEQRHALSRVLGALGVGEAQAVESVAKLQAEVKKLTRELRAARVSMATGSSGPVAQGSASSASTGDVRMAPPTGALTIAGLPAQVKVEIRRADGLEKSELRDLSDAIKSKMTSGIVVLASATPDAKVAIVVSVTPDLKGRLHAGNIVKQIAPLVGGGGGGRPDFAEAGGKDPAKIDAMLAESRSVIEKMAATA